MPLILKLGDVLDAQTEAILLTVDGSARNKKDPARDGWAEERRSDNGPPCDGAAF